MFELVEVRALQIKAKHGTVRAGRCSEGHSYLRSGCSGFREQEDAACDDEESK